MLHATLGNLSFCHCHLLSLWSSWYHLCIIIEVIKSHKNAAMFSNFKLWHHRKLSWVGLQNLIREHEYLYKCMSVPSKAISGFNHYRVVITSRNLLCIVSSVVCVCGQSLAPMQFGKPHAHWPACRMRSTFTHDQRSWVRSLVFSKLGITRSDKTNMPCLSHHTFHLAVLVFWQGLSLSPWVTQSGCETSWRVKNIFNGETSNVLNLERSLPLPILA